MNTAPETNKAAIPTAATPTPVVPPAPEVKPVVPVVAPALQTPPAR